MKRNGDGTINLKPFTLGFIITVASIIFAFGVNWGFLKTELPELKERQNLLEKRQTDFQLLVTDRLSRIETKIDLLVTGNNRTFSKRAIAEFKSSIK